VRTNSPSSDTFRAPSAGRHASLVFDKQTEAARTEELAPPMSLTKKKKVHNIGKQCRNNHSDTASLLKRSKRRYLTHTRTKHHTNLLEAGAAKKCPLNFLHIPKNAGSSVEAWGLEAGYAWGFHWASCDVKVDRSYCPVPHVPPSMLQSLFAHDNILHAHLTNPYVDSEHVFCVKRNPYDKAVSEYGWRLHEFQTLSKQSFIASLTEMGGESEEMQVCPGCKELQPCSAQGMNFFLKHVLSSIKHKREPVTVDRCHFIPQVEYIWAGSRQTCKHVLDVSNLEEEFAKLMADKGCDVPTSYPQEKESGCDNLSADDLEPKTKALIRHIYKDDFEKLGYAM